MKSPWTLLTLSIVMISVSCKKDPVTAPPANPPVNEPKVTVSTLAGEGTPSYVDGPFLTAEFSSPIDLVFSNSGSLFVTDIDNHRVREMKQGLVSAFAGSDTINIVNGRGKAAAFRFPFSITSDLAGNLYTSDINDPRIRKITPDGVVSVYAGVEAEGFRDGNADSAKFYIANFIVSDDQGNVYVSEPLDNRIRKISNTGIVSSIAGTGTAGFNDGDGAAAEFHNPGGIAIDRSGNLFVVDRQNFRIRKITPSGQVSTFAGTGRPGRQDGNAQQAGFSSETRDLVIDNKGNLYLSDDHRIRKISPDAVVTTIAGSGAGYKDGEGGEAEFNLPYGLGIDPSGNVYVADVGNNRIREIKIE
jgi:hypothetical protein